jgi:predicted ATP-grasp superfamily ATP-dependent carboligase
MIYSKCGFYKGYSFSSDYNDTKFLFLPIEEKSILDYYYQKEKNENIFSLLPGKVDFDTSRDKFRLMEFCNKENIPTPKTYFEKNELLDCSVFPILAKKRIGEGAKGMKKLDDKKKLLEFLQENGFEEYVFQEFIEGKNNVFGVFFLFKNGKLVNWNGHRRIRTYPVKGGVTVFSKEIQVKEICDAGKVILEKLNWSGIAMLEFIFDSNDGKYKLIEINPRIWGSILLSGNLIKEYLEISLDRRIDKEIPKKDFIDWYFPGEILYTLSTWKVFSLIKSTIFLYNNRKNINFIGLSYSNKIKAVLFAIYQVLQFENFKKILMKMSR